MLGCRVHGPRRSEAHADPDNTPKADPAVVDAEIGAPLVWKGKVISELARRLLARAWL